MKKKLLLGLISAFCLLLFETTKAQAPTAGFSLSQSTVCAGTMVQITDLSTGLPTAWSYSLDGSVFATTPNPTVSFNTSGTYTISMTASNVEGPSAIFSQTIQVEAAPSLTLAGNTSLCTGGSVTQTVSGADTYSWSTGSTNDNETFSPTSTTSYTVTGTNALTGCTSSTVISITVNPLPVLTVSGGTAVCIGSSSSQTVTGADTYLWDNGSTSDVIVVSPILPTTYTVTGTNTASGCTNSITVTLAVNPLPTISVTGNNTVCAGSSIVQTASGADTYLWSNGSTGDVVTFNPIANSVYTVTGTYTTTGCSDIATTTINAIPLPVLAITGNAAYCIGGSVTPTVSGADTYVWSSGSTNDSETLNPTTTTTYTVTGTNTLTGCTSSMAVTVTVNPLPVLTVSGGTAVCIGSSSSQTVTGADTYLWDNGSVVVR